MHKITIETKYKVGQKIYYLTEKENNGEWITCPACKGKEEINHNGYRFRCCTCEVNGKLWEDFPPEWILNTTSISQIQVIVTEDSFEIEYIAEDGLYLNYNRNIEIYIDKKEAIKKLKILNKEI